MMEWMKAPPSAQKRPCAFCSKQLTMKRKSQPHGGLVVVETWAHDSSKGKAWEEVTYKCQFCGSVIEHTNDPEEIAPFWWIE
jgi:hypothetical protein